jgi:TrmH family RNA methyltransferase
MSRLLHSLVRDLRLRRGRERRGLALAEGIRLVEEALAAGVTLRHVLTAPALEASARGRALQARLRSAGCPLEAVSDRVFEGLAATEHSQGVLAVVELPVWRLEQVRVGPRRPALVLDGVQDPGNVGTLVRTAFGLGAAGVLTLPGTAELGNPKTLRATMGASFRLPCLAVADAAFLEWARSGGMQVLLAAAGAPLPERRRGALSALVVGNEGAGIRPSLAPHGTKVGIPMQRDAESLNVAVAAGILLYELTRE